MILGGLIILLTSLHHCMKLHALAVMQRYFVVYIISALLTTNPLQSNLGRARRRPSRQRMHSSAACASSAMSTADKSNDSAAGMLPPYRSATFFLYARPAQLFAHESEGACGL